MTACSSLRPSMQLFPVLLGLGTIGCGLSEYEKKLAEEQQRIERFDKENKELGDPVKDPPGLPKEDWPAIFFRPPKGISAGYEDKPVHTRFFQYKGSGRFLNLYIGCAGKEKDFKATVLRHFASGTRKEGNTQTAPSGRAPLALEWITSSDSSKTNYIYLTPGAEVAIVLETSGQAETNVISASLNSLAIRNDAAKVRQEFNKRKHRP